MCEGRPGKRRLVYTCFLIIAALAAVMVDCGSEPEPSVTPTTPSPTPSPSRTPSATVTPSPGMATVAFTRWSYQTFEERICLINLDGAGLKQLTLEDGVQEHFPAFSRDGRRIAFSRRDESSQFDIFVMNSDGSGRQGLTDTGRNNQGLNDMPAWSPDNRIAFISNRDGNIEIYVMNTDGSSQTRLTENASIDWLPQWSPDGSKIAFLSDRDGAFKWWVMNPDGSGQHLLSDIKIAPPDIDVPLVLLQASWTSFMGGTIFSPIMTESGMSVIAIDDTTGRSQDLDFPDTLAVVQSPDGQFVITGFSGASDSIDIKVLGAVRWLTDSPEHDVASSCAVLTQS